MTTVFDELIFDLNPVTDTDNQVSSCDLIPEDVTPPRSLWIQREAERKLAREDRKRVLARQDSRRYRERRKASTPQSLICTFCRTTIDPDDVAVVGDVDANKQRFTLTPYPSWRTRYWGAGRISGEAVVHAACLPADITVSTEELKSGYFCGPLAGRAVYEAECDVCGRRVRPPRFLARRGGGYVYYCSAGCGAGADKLARQSEHSGIECQTCGERFTPTRGDSSYCSSKCRQKAYRLRQKGAAQ